MSIARGLIRGFVGQAVDTKIAEDKRLANLTDKEYLVLKLSYGIGCDKLSAKEIADKINMKGTSSYVRVSQLKKQAINKLKKVMDHSQVIDYL